MMQKIYQSLLTLGWALPLSLGMVAEAAYVPPQDQVPPRTRGGTAGRRSTCEVSGVTPLAPVSYLGKTSLERPTFYWITGEAPRSVGVPLEFSLMEYQPETQQLVVKQKQKLHSQSGIDRFVMPQGWTALELGKVYAWQVVALCGAPSANPYLRASIQRVHQTPQLPGTKTHEQKIRRLASQGLWYDALTLSLESGAADRHWEKIGKQLIQDLATAERKREPIGMEPEYRHSALLENIISDSGSPSP